MHDDELTAREREALRGLPHERAAGDLLEERTVGALRARGLLGSRRSSRRAPASGTWSPAWIGAAAAAGVALFAIGFASGQWLEARHSQAAFMALHRQDSAQLASVVQKAGTDYVAALNRLAQAVGTTPGPQVKRGREAALTTLHQAASEMLRITPNEPVAEQIMQGLELARARDTTLVADATQRVVWF